MGNKKPKIKSGVTLTPPKPTSVIHTPVSLSFKHVKAGKAACLSKCTATEVKDVMDCLRMLTTMSWYQVTQSGGKPGNKSGLGYTPNMPYAEPNGMSPDVKISEIRSSQTARVFGFHNDRNNEHIYYIIAFERTHKK